MLHDDIGTRVGGKAAVEDLDDRRVINAARGARFIEEALHLPGVDGDIVSQHLDRHASAEDHMLSGEDLPHAATTDEFDQTIISNAITNINIDIHDTPLPDPSGERSALATIHAAMRPRVWPRLVPNMNVIRCPVPSLELSRRNNRSSSLRRARGTFMLAPHCAVDAHRVAAMMRGRQRMTPSTAEHS